MSSAGFDLRCDSYDQLVLTTAGGEVHTGVVPVRAFPITAPEQNISLLSAEGHELAWIARLTDLPPDMRHLLERALAAREFMPQILHLRQVSSFATPSTWQIETDRGDTSFVLKGEEDIRRLTPNMLLIGDSHGIQYVIRDISALDRNSRRLLDRFL